MPILALSVRNISEQQLALLLSYIGWSYIVIWESISASRVLVWQQGLWPAGSSYQQAALYTIYKACQFPIGQGHAGTALVTGEHICVTGATVANTSVLDQLDFLTATNIQSVLCIPMLDGVLEIGSIESIPQAEHLLQTIDTFFYTASSALPIVSLPIPEQPPVAVVTRHTPSPSTSSLQSTSDASRDITVLQQSYNPSDWATIYSAASKTSELFDSKPSTAFTKWDPLRPPPPRFPEIPQAMLKKVLQPIATIRQDQQILSRGEESRTRIIHIDAERSRRKKHKESITTLRSLIPFKTKDKLSVLRGAIEHMQDLHAKVAELERDSETTKKQPSQDEIAVEAADENQTLNIRISLNRQQCSDVMVLLLNHLWSLGLIATSIDSTATEDSFRANLTTKQVGSSTRQVQPTDIETFLRKLLI